MTAVAPAEYDTGREEQQKSLPSSRGVIDLSDYGPQGARIGRGALEELTDPMADRTQASKRQPQRTLRA